MDPGPRDERSDVPRYLFDLAIGERDRARERIASLLLDEPAKTQGLYAAIDELQREAERLREYSERLDRALTQRNIEVARLRADLGDAQASLDEYRDENLALVDAMRDARALLHKPRPRAMAAASLLGDALTTRVLEMLPKEGEDDCT